MIQRKQLFHDYISLSGDFSLISDSMILLNSSGDKRGDGVGNPIPSKMIDNIDKQEIHRLYLNQKQNETVRQNLDQRAALAS